MIVLTFAVCFLIGMMIQKMNSALLVAAFLLFLFGLGSMAISVMAALSYHGEEASARWETYAIVEWICCGVTILVHCLTRKSQPPKDE